jgi:serine protease Do
VSPTIARRTVTALLFTIAVASAFGESLDSSSQRRLREATFEVVLGKPDADPLSYEKPLPLDLLPFAERTGKYTPVGTAFAIGRGRFVTSVRRSAASDCDSTRHGKRS